MYCRNCGSVTNEKAEVCIKCGYRPLNGGNYCQECGAVTNANQEICIKCGCRLADTVQPTNSFFDGLAVSESKGATSNYDFRYLDPYYQSEFANIQQSNEAYKGKWNWCAFLFGWIWALTKGCWLSAVVCLTVSIATFGVGGFIYCIIYGIRGNYIYYSHYVKHRQCII